jgi:hypothetical protein
MTHGCRDNRCIDTEAGDLDCKYGFPFPITEETHIDDRGRVRFRRRTDADLNIVSYNRTFCLKFDAHINCDIAHTTM